METVEVEIRNVRVLAKQDAGLEEIAPPYLKGQRKCEQRVQWALDEFLRARSADADDRKGKEAEA